MDWMVFVEVKQQAMHGPYHGPSECEEREERQPADGSDIAWEGAIEVLVSASDSVELTLSLSSLWSKDIY
jgi:hypothetical protein